MTDSKRKPFITVTDDHLGTAITYLLSNGTRIVRVDGFATGSEAGLHCDHDTFTRLSLQSCDDEYPDTEWTTLGKGVTGECDGWVEIKSCGVSADGLDDGENPDWDGLEKRVISEMIVEGWIAGEEG